MKIIPYFSNCKRYFTFHWELRGCLVLPNDMIHGSVVSGDINYWRLLSLLVSYRHAVWWSSPWGIVHNDDINAISSTESKRKALEFEHLMELIFSYQYFRNRWVLRWSAVARYRLICWRDVCGAVMLNICTCLMSDNPKHCVVIVLSTGKRKLSTWMMGLWEPPCLHSCVCVSCQISWHHQCALQNVGHYGLDE
jgi:hypothetical protein